MYHEAQAKPSKTSYYGQTLFPPQTAQKKQRMPQKKSAYARRYQKKPPFCRDKFAVDEKVIFERLWKGALYQTFRGRAAALRQQNKCCCHCQCGEHGDIVGQRNTMRSVVSVTETHQVAEAQQEKNARLREAFGISEYFVDGSSFDPDRQAKEKVAKSNALQEQERQQAIDREQERSRDKAQAQRYRLVSTPTPEREAANVEEEEVAGEGVVKEKSGKKKKRQKESSSSEEPKKKKKKKSKKKDRSGKSKDKKKKKKSKKEESADDSASDDDSDDSSSSEEEKKKKNKKKEEKVLERTN